MACYGSTSKYYATFITHIPSKISLNISLSSHISGTKWVSRYGRSGRTQCFHFQGRQSKKSGRTEKTPVIIHQITWRGIPDHWNLREHRCHGPKSQIVFVFRLHFSSELLISSFKKKWCWNFGINWRCVSRGQSILKTCNQGQHKGGKDINKHSVLCADKVRHRSEPSLSKWEETSWSSDKADRNVSRSQDNRFEQEEGDSEKSVMLLSCRCLTFWRRIFFFKF